MAGYYISTDSMNSESKHIYFYLLVSKINHCFFQDPDPHSVYYFALSSWDDYEIVWQLPYVQGTIYSDWLIIALSIEH